MFDTIIRPLAVGEEPLLLVALKHGHGCHIVFFPSTTAALIYGLPRRPCIRYDIDRDAKEWPSRHCGTIFGFGARFIRKDRSAKNGGC